jgi:hypothetical protein
MLDPALTFDSASHTYRVGGVIVPGVTSLLESLHSFAGVDHDVLEAAKHRGSSVHAACHYLDDDDLDEARLKVEQPDVHAYLAGYRKFLRDCTPNYTAIEVPVYHPTLRFAGTPDRIGELTYGGKRIPRAVIDLKTSLASHPCWAMQCAAYAHAAGVPTARQFSLQLRNDGTYRLKEWIDPDAWPAFVSLLTLRTWKERNRL